MKYFSSQHRFKRSYGHRNRTSALLRQFTQYNTSRVQHSPCPPPPPIRSQVAHTPSATTLSDSIIDHLFLPCHLPSSSECDYLIRNEHQDEYNLLEFMKEFLKSLTGKFSQPIFSVLFTCFERWKSVQDGKRLSSENLQKTIDQLVPGEFLPLYFHHQNAAILIEIESDNDIERTLISTWQVQLSTENITSSFLPHFSCFPVPTFQLQDRSQLRSIAHCELLVNFMQDPFEYHQTKRNSSWSDETRDIPVSHYVTDWWISRFSDIRKEKQSDASIPFKKKHRDHIRWNTALLPFRRSGLWMVVKTVLQTILNKRLGRSGKIVYKLFITSFLTHIIYIRQKYMPCLISNVDLLVHCSRKIVRRLNKIDLLRSTIENQNIGVWVENMIQEINLRLAEILPNPTWQMPIHRHERLARRSLPNLPDVNQIKIYRHSCEQLKNYLNTSRPSRSLQQTSINYTQSDLISTGAQFEDQLPSPTLLTNASTDNIQNVLTIVEIWIETCLDRWMNRLSLSENGSTQFKKFLDLFEKYQDKALKHYYSPDQHSDCFGYTRFILTSLTILRSMHQKLCADPRFARLSSHSVHIPNLFELFEYLIPPTGADMIRAFQLYDYFQGFVRKPYPDLLSDIERNNAFGIHFASESVQMKDTLGKIRAEAERDKQAKCIEFDNAKKKYLELVQEAERFECVYEIVEEIWKNRKRERRQHKLPCRRCDFFAQANNIHVDIYECPIPEKESNALAVVFELQMPDEIRCYRDMLWQFVNHPSPTPSHGMHEWLSSRPHTSKLGKFYTGISNCKVKLVSSRKSYTETHYSKIKFHKWISVEAFLHQNDLRVQINPTKPTTLDNECRILTPQLEHSNYKLLQFAVRGTQCQQNHAIAQSVRCPLGLKKTEFIEFGSFRSGHRLQWSNLLSTLELDSLSFDEESVLLLITHSLTQYGPVTQSWCSESHQQLLDDNFVDELILRLDQRLNDCQSNWQNECMLLLISIIIMRILTICNSTKTEQIVQLALKCREIGESSMENISQIFKTITSINIKEIQQLRDKIVIIATACLFTFLMYPSYRSLSDSSIVSFLTAITSIHDNSVLNKRTDSKSVFMRNLIRWRDRIIISIQPVMAKYLKETSYRSLHQFAEIHWGMIKTKQYTGGQWIKRSIDNGFDGWYVGQYESDQIFIDFIRGRFLINGTSICFLPDEITSNELYRRTFNKHIFEVQPGGSTNTYITKHAYHDDQIYYEFHLNRNHSNPVVIRSRHRTGNTFKLIPHRYFQNEFAAEFIENYSHWIDEKTNLIQFRPIDYEHAEFLTNISYELQLEDGFLITKNTQKTQILINQSSPFFENLYQQYFNRLDLAQYVYMFRDNADQIIRTKQMPHDCFIHIHVSRLGLSFKYDVMKGKIFSRQYSDMYINRNQSFGTLTRLKSGLLLSSIVEGNRKFLVPFGAVEVKRMSDKDHQSVCIERTQSMEFACEYFVFTLNDRLHLLQSSNSPAGWLYLSLLHATTSHVLPDIYTGMTGMERALQILYSAGCWTDQPYDSFSLNIAYQIAKISPKVEYYPSHLTCMEKIEWNVQSLPHSLQHFGYYLIIKKLVDTSRQLSFMYPSSDLQTSGLPKNDEKLLAKLYWDYRDSYNPTSRLSEEMEDEILLEYSAYSYKPSPIFDSVVKNTNVYRPLEDLYKSGELSLRDPSTLCCFPLQQWMKETESFKNIFISLLKLTYDAQNQPDKTERLEILFNFLHYTSNKHSIKPFYLTILKTILKNGWNSFISIDFPPFGPYHQIEQTQFDRASISLYSISDTNKRTKILDEAEEASRQNLSYTDQSKLFDGKDRSKDSIITNINALFKSWRLNKTLREFVQCIEQWMDSVYLYVSINRIIINQQQFVLESRDQHYQIQLKSGHISIDKQLLLSAFKKYCCQYSDDIMRPNQLNPIVKNQPFPEEIFPSINHDENPLSDIAQFFKQRLHDSWQSFQSELEFEKDYPRVEEFQKYQHSIRDESARLWRELIGSIRTDNELLFDAGLALRMTPSILISLLHQIWLNEEEQKQSIPVNSTKRQKIERFEDAYLKPEQCILLGGLLVNWIIEQQLQRTIHCAKQNLKEDFEKEASNIPHVNWIPSEHVPWLILELEMNITIREVQVEVTRHMIDPKTKGKSIVMQMNMGEGKTSVIIPMLALSLCSSTSSLVRIIVLKALLNMNYQSLRSKLGGLLNRRIFSFACRRDMNFDALQINRIFQRVQQAMKRQDIIITAPEYILSFDLLAIDKCRRQNFEVGRLMLNIQQWFKRYVRDVLDESDEILHVKYQLIYTIGNQVPVDGGAQRWKTIQSILELVKKNAEDFAQNYDKHITYEKSARSSHFPSFRLLSHEPFPDLAAKIVNDWLTSFRQEERELLSSFILKANKSIERFEDQFPNDLLQRILILRGLLSSEVLFVALTKRYRVNYGLNSDSKFNRLMAVPFRAKDVATENTEFGHPDIAILLTQLFYYYDGLTDGQIEECFKRLRDTEKHPEDIYHEWISYENKDHPDANIAKWEGINLKDDRQKMFHLFPTFRKHMLVINYYLNHFVFPREAKQFPQKLISSPWDLASDRRTKIITGFSGTNDTQLLLPVHINQCDLPQLMKTDAVVLNNLLRKENEFYQSLPINVNIENILEQILNNEQFIQVILDVGALFLNGTNRQIAVQWLEKSDRMQIDYAIYFLSDTLFVCDRQNQHHLYATSPASEQLQRCVFYLDEVHTRGTDFKFPNGFRAAVTLGNGLTKDRFVQACMRMRKLGKGHSLSFYASHEVDQQICMLTKKSNENERLKLFDILRWVYENTQEATWDGLHHWASQSLSFQRKLAAFQTIQWTDEQQQFAKSTMTKLACDCIEPEVLKLDRMYGMAKSEQKMAELHRSRCQGFTTQRTEINDVVLNRLEQYGGSRTLLGNTLDEEQERELEREVEQEVEEERQQERPVPPVPHEPFLHEEIKRLVNSQDPMMNLAQFPSVFSPLPQSFSGTSFFSHSQPVGWRATLWATNDFQRVIKTEGESLDGFLRPPRWVIIYRQEHIIFVSPHEANWLIRSLQSSTTTTLRLLLPRIKRFQSILINTPSLSVPLSHFSIPNDWLVQLFVFNGTLYFKDVDEQTAYCRFLQMNECNFKSSPSGLVRKILESRHHSHIPAKSHVGAIILDTKKLLS